MAAAKVAPAIVQGREQGGQSGRHDGERPGQAGEDERQAHGPHPSQALPR